MIDDMVEGYVARRTADGYAEDWDLDQLWTALKTLYPVVGHRRRARGGLRRRPGRADRRVPRRGAQGRRAGGLRPSARRRLGAGDHARARAPRRALGARPQVARAPLRDGLPAGGHRPARDGPARPAGRVPARGLRHVRRDDGRHQGGVGRLPVQPRGAGRGRTAGEGEADGRGSQHHERGRQGSRGPAAAGPAAVHRADRRRRRQRGTARRCATIGRRRVRRRPAQRPCPCGSGKKYKRCHGDPRKTAAPDLLPLAAPRPVLRPGSRERCTASGPSMPSSRRATAVERAPRHTSAHTSATPSAGSLTCSERTTPRGGPSVSPLCASTRLLISSWARPCAHQLGCGAHTREHLDDGLHHAAGPRPGRRQRGAAGGRGPNSSNAKSSNATRCRSAGGSGTAGSPVGNTKARASVPCTPAVVPCTEDQSAGETPSSSSYGGSQRGSGIRRSGLGCGG